MIFLKPNLVQTDFKLLQK